MEEKLLNKENQENQEKLEKIEKIEKAKINPSNNSNDPTNPTDPISPTTLKKLEEENNKKIAKINSLSYKGDAYLKANCISKLFFFWAFKILQIAQLTPLESKHLGNVEGENQSKNFLKNIKDIWIGKNYKSKKKCALLCTVLRANLCRIITLIILTFFIAALEFLNVYSLKCIINYFQGQELLFDIPFYGFGIFFILCKALSIFITRQNGIFQTIIGFKSSIELNTLIFDKLLRASPASFMKRASEGEIINFIQVDSPKLSAAIIGSPQLLVTPIQITIYVIMLFNLFGVTFLFSFGTLLMFLVFNVIIQNNNRKNIKELLKRKDHRLKLTTETINSLKILKLYAWEDTFLKRIIDSRQEELKIGRKYLNNVVFSITFLWTAPIAVSVVTVGSYLYINESLDIAKILICITIFNLLQTPIRGIPTALMSIFEVVISMERIEKYLIQEDIETSNVLELGDENGKQVETVDFSIKLDKCNFSWGANEADVINKEKEDKLDKENLKNKKKEDLNPKINQSDINQSDVNQSDINQSVVVNDSNNINNNATSNTFISQDESMDLTKNDDLNKTSLSLNNPNFNLTDKEISFREQRISLKNISFCAKKGELIGVIGEVGSGKSSFLQAILNNLILLNPNPSTPSNLLNSTKKPENLTSTKKIITNGSISYISQVPWIQNETIRENILFFKEFNDLKYRNTLDKCQLNQDIQFLTGGDMTEIGQKGINLSGGQKARISIARAVYADTDIYLFDDPISALDANVGEKIMNECIVNLLKDKTRILVTHAQQYLKLMDRIIFFKGGEISWQGTYEQLVEEQFYKDLQIKEKKKKEEDKEESLSIDQAFKKSDLNLENDNKNITRITKDEEKVIGNVKFQVYMDYITYLGGKFLFGFILFIMLLWIITKIGADLWLNYWVNLSSQDNWIYFWIYAGVSLSGCLFIMIRVILLMNGTLRIIQRLHDDMLTKLINAPINLFHDRTPKGQILNRLSNDLEQVQNMNFWVGNCIVGFYQLLGCIFICAYFSIWSLCFLPILLAGGIFVVKYYLNGSRDLKRLEGISKSPILNTVGEAIPGAMIIRASKCQEFYNKKIYKNIDNLFKVNIFTTGCQNFFGLNLDMMALMFMIFLIVFAVVFEDQFTPSSIGLILTYAITLQGFLFYLFDFIGVLVNCMVCMERCINYTKIEVESTPNEKPLNGPLTTNGDIEFLDYSVKYRPDTELVLRNISLKIKGGEKVGIVGRTGSGKSTICLSIFRILEPFGGSIKIDGVDITTVDLKVLRSSLTIIPQDPSLMQGTLRYNIDPLEKYLEKDIKFVMQSIGFWYIAENSENGLDMIINEGGENLSVGEKQLICITRAILRKSKIIVMDEATANIDLKTEEIINKAVYDILKESTVITIAHRIKTIVNYDKILVLEQGKVLEYDSPKDLINDQNSYFYNLYSKST